MDAFKLPAALLTTPVARPAASILAAALQAVDPERAVRRNLRLDGDGMWVGETRLALAEHSRVILIAFGKASPAMAHAAAAILGDRLTRGVVIAKHLGPSAQLPPQVQVLVGEHPVPGEQSLAATAAALAQLHGLRPEDVVLCLISGGGSALFTQPLPDVQLADLQALTRVLMASGAAIEEINTLRRHLDRVKGGGVLRQAAPARVAALILSDVVGNRLEDIASGPTAADPSSYVDAHSILLRYGLWDSAPHPVRQVLHHGLDGHIPETVKPGDAQAEQAVNRLVGSNAIAAQAAQEEARRLGLHSAVLTSELRGEARSVGARLAADLRRRAQDGPLPACLILGGETTVTVRGNGRGGRNQEVALAAVEPLAGCPNGALVTLATDGEDGPTDSAGAGVTGQSLARARAAGLDPAAALAHNNAYPFFAALDDHLITGPTGTNVNDLTFLFAW